jgi:UDP-N-acetylmuramoylalanine--D-glutamate ligase
MRELMSTYHGASLVMKLKNGFRRSLSKPEYVKRFRNGFPPLRLKFSGKHHGITMINDSGAGSIDATYFSLKQIDNPLIWIVWNDDANAPFEELDLAVLQHVRKIIVAGKAFLKIDYLLGNELEIIEAKNIDEAVTLALKEARQGEYVLFSPATKKIEGVKNKMQLFKLMENKFKSFIR